MTDTDRPLCDCPEPCACYAEGYAAGKDKAYFEVLASLQGPPHAEGCVCQPCAGKPRRPALKLLDDLQSPHYNHRAQPPGGGAHGIAPGGPRHHDAAGSAALPHDRRVRSTSPG